MLGSNLVRGLLEKGYAVKAFLENGRETGTLKGLDIEISRGDLLSCIDVRKAMDGCPYVIHTAAVTNVIPNRSEMIRRINIDGTRNIIKAALDCRVKKMIHVGTANSFGPGTRDNPGDETRPYSGRIYKLDYMDSKRQAQDEVLQAVAGNGLPAVVVNPTFMLGPYDSKPGSGEMILAVASGKIPGYTRGGRNYIHVLDVAVGIINALEKGNPGECYILGNHNLSYKEIFSLIAEIIGVRAPRLYLPPALAKPFSVVAPALSMLAGTKPRLNLSMARISCDDHYFSSAKAIKHLDLPQTDIRIAISDCYEWFVKNGYIKK
jgi:dihydroflavonol-4-reductase